LTHSFMNYHPPITCPECGHRIEPEKKEVLRYGPLVLRVDVRLLKIGDDGEPRRIAWIDMSILAELVRHHDRVCNKDHLMTVLDLWEASPYNLRTYIHRVRKLIRGSGAHIATIHGSGYMLTTRDIKPFEFGKTKEE